MVGGIDNGKGNVFLMMVVGKKIVFFFWFGKTKMESFGMVSSYKYVQQNQHLKFVLTHFYMCIVCFSIHLTSPQVLHSLHSKVAFM